MIAPQVATILLIDTSTRISFVALGRDTIAARSQRDVKHRHGSHVLEQIEEVLADSGANAADIEAVAVGTGPGSFTGLRVGLATAKTIAYARSLPIVGVMSSDALRRAAVVAGAITDAAVVLPAGAHDHYLARAGSDPVLVAPGALLDELDGQDAIAIDLDDGPLGGSAERLGTAALEGMAGAMLGLARERLVEGSDDIAGLVPAYVALPRGVSRGAEDLGWSPDLR